MEASQVADSPRDLRDRIPGPRGEILAKRLVDQRHEYRTLRSRQVGAEDFAVLHRENARAVHLDRQRDSRFGPPAQERDDAFRLRTDLEWLVGIGGEQRPQLLDWPHEREKR